MKKNIAVQASGEIYFILSDPCYSVVSRHDFLFPLYLEREREMSRNHASLKY
jgi:hypothetical protein